MWVWRRKLKIPWILRRKNKSIIEELEEPVRLSVLSEKPIMRYCGHMARRNEENLNKDTIWRSTWFKRKRKISYQMD